jgi:hypothetical protein
MNETFHSSSCAVDLYIEKCSSTVTISPVTLVVNYVVIVLGSFCFLQALRKCEKIVTDMGWFPFSLK